MKTSTNFLKYTTTDPIRRRLIDRFLNEVLVCVKELKPKTILDAGCGEGFVLSLLLEHSIKAKMTGIDISSEAIKIAKSNNRKMSLLKGDIYGLSFDDNAFDLVLCSEVLEHLDDPRKALKELKRVSKKYLLLSVPNEPWFMLGSLIGGKYVRNFGNHPEHVNHWNSRTFTKFLYSQGLSMIKTCSLSTFPWCLVLCQKTK